MYTREQKQTSGSYRDTIASCWDFFDKIYCISLSTRKDRRILAHKEFTKVGLEDRVEFITVTKHLDNPEQGIFESHMHCLQKGLAGNGQHILIFEDDVFFQKFDPRNLLQACEYLNAPQNTWDGLFLGCLTSDSKKMKEQPLTQIRYRCLAHAYGLNRGFAKTIAWENWSGIPFDELLRRKQSTFYGLYPMCAFQGRSGTDNHTYALHLVRRILGGLPFIQNANQFYHRHKTIILLSHFTIFVLLWLMMVYL